MAVSDGQRANEINFNAAFLSRTQDSDTIGVIGLNAPGSGAAIVNTQQQINDNITTLADHESRITTNEGDISTLFATKENLSDKDQPNGYAGLDGSGRISTSALPVTALEFQGVWDASTNTPTLADGVGNTGDIYRVSVAGSQDLGSGTLNFVVGDWVTYNGTIWERSDFGLDVQVLDDLNDVDTTSSAPVSGDSLVYNGSLWVPGSPSLSADDLTDVDTTSTAPVIGDVLEWDGSNWVPQAPSGGFTPAFLESAATLAGYPFAANVWGDLASIVLPANTTWDLKCFVDLLMVTGAGTSGDILLGLSSTAGNVSPGTEGINFSRTQVNNPSQQGTYIGFHVHNIAVGGSPITIYMKTLIEGAVTNVFAAYKHSARRVA